MALVISFCVFFPRAISSRVWVTLWRRDSPWLLWGYLYVYEAMITSEKVVYASCLRATSALDLPPLILHPQRRSYTWACIVARRTVHAPDIYDCTPQVDASVTLSWIQILEMLWLVHVVTIVAYLQCCGFGCTCGSYEDNPLAHSPDHPSHRLFMFPHLDAPTHTHSQAGLGVQSQFRVATGFPRLGCLLIFFPHGQCCPARGNRED